jgi:D-amino-acid dehydrogenase
MKHVVVVGAGVIGLCTAHYAAARGYKVTVLDREPRKAEGCSHGNAGMIVPSHFTPLAAPGMVAMGLRWMFNPESPFYIQPRWDTDLFKWLYRFWRSANRAHVRRSAPLIRDLSLASRACFQELAAERGNRFGLVQKGLIMLCRTQHGLKEERETAERARALGIQADVLSLSDVQDLDPGITYQVEGGVYYPGDCHLSPARFLGELESGLLNQNVKFCWGTEVNAWEHAGGRVRKVHTDAGAVEGDEFVLCGGAWSAKSGHDLGLQLPLQAGKGYSLTLPTPRQLPALCSILTEARVAVTPMGSSLRVGGTMELSGINPSIQPRRVRGIMRSLPKYYPAFEARDFEGIQPWVGLRPCSPDGLPYLGKPRDYENLVVATGHAMMGLSLGPVTGKIVAELLAGQKCELNLDLLHPDRFR